MPLSVVGNFLNYTGNYMLHYVYSVLKKKIFYPNHKVMSIQLMSNGDIIIHTIKTICKIKKNEKQIIFTQK